MISIKILKFVKEQIQSLFKEKIQGVLICFDLDNRESFINLAKWEKDMKEYGVDKKAVIFIVGNKSDLKSKV